jgi:hypothetical protein
MAAMARRFMPVLRVGGHEIDEDVLQRALRVSTSRRMQPRRLQIGQKTGDPGPLPIGVS